MALTTEGALKIAAGKLNISVEEYKDRGESGEKWVERMRGFAPVSPVGVAEFPAGVAENVSKNMKLLGDSGYLQRIALTDGHPVSARLTIRAPQIDSRYYEPAHLQNQYLVINAANGSGIFGGLALNISISRDATPIKRVIYSIK